MEYRRASYEESCELLRERGLLVAGPSPQVNDHLPQHDDAVLLGIRFFRTLMQEKGGLANLTLPRTFFGRSEISQTSFRNTDLSESNLCWNDFIQVDFSHACLAKSDIRASRFTGVNFTGVDLRGADFRHSFFDGCVFDNAALEGTVFTNSQGKTLSLSLEQRRVIDWRNKPGDEPGGG
jgi:uncharacterized protein YjbI with pentapeptide repeats